MSDVTNIGNFQPQEISRIAASIHQAISTDPKCEFSLEFHPPIDDEFKAGAHYTVTAISKRNKLEATMIVRGEPWWVAYKFQFTKEGKGYGCRNEPFKENEELKALETLFSDKGRDLYQEGQRQSAERGKRVADEHQSKLRSQAEGLINTLSPRRRKRNPEV